MAMIIEVFCPLCKDIQDTLMENPATRTVACTECGSEWDRVELQQICSDITSRASTVAFVHRYAESVRILVRHMINPYTGKCYG